MSIDVARRTAEIVARGAYGRLVAILAARSRDIAAAEDALAEAMVSALSTWPERGVPTNPESLVDHRCPQPYEECGPS